MNLSKLSQIFNSIKDEFTQFISRGNVIDLAVGIIMGAEFGKIVSSLVSDIIMPPIGFLLQGINFENLKIFLDTEQKVSINYGNFVQNLVSFFVISISVFFMIKFVNYLDNAKKIVIKDEEFNESIKAKNKSEPDK
ncbi:MAG: large conductance mechanosensitive channel protein MscL [Candidatus Dojkabacteria bacterium]|nr:large conductance mechanosensitive channel protein MscL [Candidatus Dojkabacteria bacterium]